MKKPRPHEPADAGGDETREQAAAGSRHCALCGGEGMVPIYHWAWKRGEGRIGVHPLNGALFATESAAHCVCRLGRWIRARTEPVVRDRIPDGKEVAAGNTPWSLNPPDFSDEENYADDSGELRRRLLDSFRRPIGRPAAAAPPRTAAEIERALRERAESRGEEWPLRNPDFPRIAPTERELREVREAERRPEGPDEGSPAAGPVGKLTPRPDRHPASTERNYTFSGEGRAREDSNLQPSDSKAAALSEPRLTATPRPSGAPQAPRPASPFPPRREVRPPRPERTAGPGPAD